MGKVKAVLSALAVTVSAFGVTTTAAAQTPSYPREWPSGYLKPIAPVRVADSRSNLGASGADIVAGRDVTIDPLTDEVLAAAGVGRDEVVAVVVNLTATETARPGFVTVWPAGDERPVVSNLNAIAAGTTIANLATVAVGSGGRLSVYSMTGGHVVVDVQGVYETVGVAPAEGRFVALPPTRLLDTRDDQSPWGDGETRGIDFTSHGVPADASAVVFNLTATNTTGAGFFTAFPSGGPRPLASNLNIDVAGQTRANQVIAAAANGHVDVFALRAADLVVDVAGYYTGDRAERSMRGVFRAIEPRRSLDSRTIAADGWPGRYDLDAALAQHGVVPPGTVAAVMNVTIVEPVAASYLTVFPTGTTRPATSTVNASAGDVVANHAIVAPTGMFSQVSVYGLETGHALLDVFGYFVNEQQIPDGVEPHFTFRSTDSDGTPFTWNKCAPIRYYVDKATGTPEEHALIPIAVARTAEASGYEFEYAGEASDADSYPSPDRPGVVIGFVPRNDPLLAAHGNPAGLAITQNVPGTTELVSGRVRVEAGRQVAQRALETLMHEIGHILGLGHADSMYEVMYPTVSVLAGDEPSFGPGDLEGFAELYDSAWCH